MMQHVKNACLAALCCFALVSCKEKTANTALKDYDAALNKRIRKTIDDDEKRDKLEMLHAESRLRQLDLALIFVEGGVQMRNKTTLTREEATAILKDSAGKRAKTFQDVANIRLQMRALVTEDEWNKIYQVNETAADAPKKEN